MLTTAVHRSKPTGSQYGNQAMNDKYNPEVGAIDYLAIQREANRMRAEAVSQLARSAVRNIAATLSRYFHNGAHGTPARG